MRRELTRRHSLLLEKKAVKNFPRRIGKLIKDLYRYQKWSELISFLLWEVSHKSRLYPKNSYLKFADQGAITLEKDGLSEELDEKVFQFFRNRGLCATRSQYSWKLQYLKNDGESLGCVYPDDKVLYRSLDQGRSIQFVYRFPGRIKSIFVSSQKTVFVCLEGSVYRGSDNGGSFTKVVELGSPVSFFRNNNAMTETPDGTLLIGEYGNFWEGRGWRKLAYIYFSFDGGKTWDKSNFLITRGINKHVHIVKYSKLLGRILVADGDNKKKLWIIDPGSQSDFLRPDKWKPVNKFHIQMGGYTSIVENEEKILFGTDYQGGTNFIVETSDGKKFTRKIVPDPYRRSPIDNMVQRRAKDGTEIWANLPYSTANTKCLLMYSNDGGESWHKVFEYHRANHKTWLISSSNEVSDVLYFSVEDTINKTRAVYQVTDWDE